MKIRVRVFVSGRVQGVFFREETRWRAKEHNVAGWVRNLSDGRVEAVFEGEDGDVTKMIGFCRRGPPLLE
jgi:acylphosphatase